MSAATPVFVIETDHSSLIVTPQRNISSLAEDEVQQQWDDILSQLNKPDTKNVVFDFCNVTYFGSSMLEVMLSMWKRIAEKGGKLAVCNLSETGLEIVKLAKFDTIWHIGESRNAVVESITS